MTQRRNRDAVSNYFDDVLRDVAPRGSSFCDIDAVWHDGPTGRFLFAEFKTPGEPLPSGQDRMLQGLAAVDRVTVWTLGRRADGRFDWYDVAQSADVEVITVGELRQRFAAWWGVPCPPLSAGLEPAEPLNDAAANAAITSRDIHW